MIIKDYTIRKVILNDEEKEALEKIHTLINDIYNKSNYSEIQFEGKVADMLDDLQETIKCIIG